MPRGEEVVDGQPPPVADRAVSTRCASASTTGVVARSPLRLSSVGEAQQRISQLFGIGSVAQDLDRLGAPSAIDAVCHP